METNNKVESEATLLLLRVAVSTGATNVHVYSLPDTEREAKEAIHSIIEPIATALDGKAGFIHLPNPSTVYNPKHIVYIEAVFKGPGEWEDPVRTST